MHESILSEAGHRPGHALANPVSLAARLAENISALDLEIDADAQRRMLEYAALVIEWNGGHRAFTGHDGEVVMGNHLIDCVAVLPHLTAGTIADVGSGAGLPGIPLAIARPQHAVTLFERDHKKSAFLQVAVSKLGLTNVEVAKARVEAWHGWQTFDTVISRAFSDLEEFVRLAGRLCAPHGALAAMKVVYPHEELTQIASTFTLRSVIPLSIPGTRAGRHLVLLEPKCDDQIQKPAEASDQHRSMQIGLKA